MTWYAFDPIFYNQIGESQVIPGRYDLPEDSLLFTNGPRHWYSMNLRRMQDADIPKEVQLLALLLT